MSRSSHLRYSYQKAGDGQCKELSVIDPTRGSQENVRGLIKPSECHLQEVQYKAVSIVF